MQDRPRPTVGAPQPRDLVRVAFGPSMLALAVIAAVVLVQLVVANSDLTGTFGAVASMWLAVHGVPVSISGQQLGALPLAPVAVMVWATARATARVTPPNGSWLVIRWIVASAVGGPLLIAAVSLAVVHDAASVVTALQTPDASRAFLGVAAVHGVGAMIGIRSNLRRLLPAPGPPQWLTGAVRPAVVGVAALLALSCAVVAASLVVHWGTMHTLFGITDSIVGQLSLALLSLLYLPNVAVGAAAVTVGSSAHIGFATFSAFTVFGGDIPALPILAAAPTPPLGPVWVALLIVGAASGVALGQQCALRPLPPAAAFAQLAAASVFAAAGLAVLAFAGSGPLGNFGHVGVDQSTFGPAAFLWFFVVGGLTVVMAGGIRPGPRAGTPPPVGDEPDPSTQPISLDDSTAAIAVGAADTEPEPDPEPEPEPEPGPPPPPVRPAPDVEDLEDLMFVDSDIDTDVDPGRPG